MAHRTNRYWNLQLIRFNNDPIFATPKCRATPHRRPCSERSHRLVCVLGVARDFHVPRIPYKLFATAPTMPGSCPVGMLIVKLRVVQTRQVRLFTERHIPLTSPRATIGRSGTGARKAGVRTAVSKRITAIQETISPRHGPIPQA